MEKANVPTMMVRMVRKVRALLPQKSAHTFFQRLVMTALPAMPHFPFHACPPFDATPRAWLRTDSAIRRVDRTRGPKPPQGRFQRRARRPGVYVRGRTPFHRRFFQVQVAG